MQKFAIYSSMFGPLKIVEENNCVTFIDTVHEEIEDYGQKTELIDKVFQQLTEYFNGERMVFDFPMSMKGTEFQKKVWKALCDIPYGETRSYKEIAIAVGNEKACRAVGMANNKNPIAIAVPCHRVIGSNKSLVGYAGGLEMKKKLLDLEKTKKLS